MPAYGLGGYGLGQYGVGEETGPEVETIGSLTASVAATGQQTPVAQPAGGPVTALTAAGGPT